MTRKQTATNLIWPDDDDAQDDLTHLDPIPSYEESLVAPRPPGDGSSPALHILGATWGGVTVTPDIQALAGNNSDTLTLDMRNIFRHLTPDPAPGKTKVLTVMYRFNNSNNNSAKGGSDEEDEGLRLLLAPEGESPSRVTLTRHATAEQLRRSVGRNSMHVKLAAAAGAGAGPGARPLGSQRGQVEILAVLYGPRRIDDPAVLRELALFFEGRRGQIRMTNRFFGGDPWPYKQKSWSVYFRFLGSPRVQVVTGWEDGALEVPWTRDC
ncbi:uncharacterized protein B0T15DRAFT_532176 [Chaetomium strumarium]|uniref:Uncharacterized protein n=1 Tax=Chaetomium strumarium TaxID=1170767 RepID=A0AAJ0M1D2_9PEZI|nr:hypothetical protein B0T15DRAFT_532176 [Chaetomium strumarium]